MRDALFGDIAHCMVYIPLKTLIIFSVFFDAVQLKKWLDDTDSTVLGRTIRPEANTTSGLNEKNLYSPLDLFLLEFLFHSVDLAEIAAKHFQ
jgi:hypothetical protein